jgi:hypothetical protein
VKIESNNEKEDKGGKERGNSYTKIVKIGIWGDGKFASFLCGKLKKNVVGIFNFFAIFIILFELALNVVRSANYCPTIMPMFQNYDKFTFRLKRRGEILNNLFSNCSFCHFHDPLANKFSLIFFDKTFFD